MPTKPIHEDHGIPLLPVPIRAASYVNGITWGQLGTVEEAAAKTEVARMLGVMERYGACQQALRFRDGRRLWTVVYPKGSRYKDGPEQPLAWLAILENYARNDKFRGQLMHAAAPGADLHDLAGIVDRSLQKDQDHFDALRQDAVERFTFSADKTAERLGLK